ncbi:Uu.00g076420.m01.CDS01 [Anthostomella pinea]|uniref:Uu.00g076420.m01.CDS01 n=1 Tax=Anthostomella pinea TaxID=933095 RepID=A0AAI8YLU5_9PEZI|nr:Uu.00g076420.m01.CDS01 [Anthostomella pinea]
MDIIIPEVLDRVCSFLDVEDVRTFRLCCRAYADVGARYAHRELIFYLHQDDLDELRRISLRPIASKNVHSLVYVGHTMESDRMSSHRFMRYYYDFVRSGEKVKAQLANEAPPPRLKQRQLGVLFKKYEAVMDQQEKILSGNTDITYLKDAIARFAALRSVTMSSGFWFLKGMRRTPFEGCLTNPGSNIEPEGCRQIESLLAALCEAEISLAELTVGTFTSGPSRCVSRRAWKEEEGIIPGRAVPEAGIEVPGCRRLMETGVLRDFIASLQCLETLYIVFVWHSDEHGYPAKLGDIMQPQHHWDHLADLTLGNITCERQDLMAVLKRHKGTLTSLCLRDIQLRTTSWQLLLPEIRGVLQLNKACICGELFGHEEDSPRSEYRDLGEAEYDETPLLDAVNEYVTRRGRSSCPLNSTNRRD